MGGAARQALAALDLRSGTVLGWQARVAKKVGSEPAYVDALALSGNRLYVGSTNLLFAGNQQPRGVAALDANTGRVLPWMPRKKSYSGYLAVGDVDTILVQDEVLTSGRDGWGVTSAHTGRVCHG